MKNGKLGVALVGLGMYSTEQPAPALRQTQHCYLAGIVTGSTKKAAHWQRKYALPVTACYSYETFDSIKDNAAVDIVYVVLPNVLHPEYVIRAAQAGKHVICEKPMATTVEDCDRMMAACKEAGVQLSIGYRLHFEPHNKIAMRVGRESIFGKLISIETGHGLSNATGWRINKPLSGGGPLVDMGIYCVQAVRYVTGSEPVAITAQEGFKHHPEKFRNVEESIAWQMEMPDGLVAHCTSSYTKRENYLRIKAEEGWLELAPAYSFGGIKGRTAKGNIRWPQINQQAAQMDDFALCIKEGRPTRVGGEEGRQDVKILQAIYQAMTTGERIVLSPEKL